MAAEVICQFEMTYAGVKRYKGEIFRLIGARNDDTLVRIGHVRPITGDTDIPGRVRDDTGREFTDESSRVAFRLQEGSDPAVIIRRPGRPKGAKDTAPRRRRAEG